jgi:bifunctional ADP-heptose synthase (sugar kinase/adenylyltransferase)
VDTRTKILTSQAARDLRLPRLVVVTGYFDLLRAAHVCELEAVRSRTAAGALLAIVLPWDQAVLSQRARAEMAAALRVLDYVVIPDENHAEGDVSALLAALHPIEVVRLEAADARRNRELIQHVHQRHSS